MKIDRLVGIIMTLLQKERADAKELAELFEVSPRTIYRDMEAINMAGIPVRSLPGPGGGFEIMPEYKLDKKVFSAAELASILTGLSGLFGALRGEELAGALAKVKSFVPAEKAEEIERKINQICMDFGSWTGGRDLQPYLEMIKTALRDHKLLHFAYTAHHGKRSVRAMEPCQLVWKGGHWYIYGYCRGRDDFRLFKLSRMSELKIGQETFIPRDYPEPVLDFEETVKAMQTGVRIRIHRSVLDRVMEYCAPDSFVPDGDAHYTVDFPFIENDYHYDILLGLGDRCECLSPPHIREEMKQKIHRMAALYDEEGADTQ